MRMLLLLLLGRMQLLPRPWLFLCTLLLLLLLRMLLLPLANSSMLLLELPQWRCI